jgi:DNA (cytosine-5)-methyltransferase 1
VKPRLLDLFSGAGGAARGYQLAGFHVTGVDIRPQPHYAGDEFIQADAIEYLVTTRALGFDAVHASPPCQAYSTTRTLHDREYPMLIGPVRVLLDVVGLPSVIENVVGAPLIAPVRLCGSSFGLGVRRHRLFEMSQPPIVVPPCAHQAQPEPIDVTGSGARRVGVRPGGGGGNSRKPRDLAEARAAMGIDWMTRQELAEAVPPAFTEWIGRRLLAAIEDRAA